MWIFFIFGHMRKTTCVVFFFALMICGCSASKEVTHPGSASASAKDEKAAQTPPAVAPRQQKNAEVQYAQ